MRCSLYCQVCSARFFGVSIFKKHLCSSEHVKKMKDIFPQGAISNFVPHVVFMDLKQAHAIEPVVGLSLLTLCFSPRLAMYLCHVCEQCVPLDRILNHIFSSEHCISYFSYTNPDVLSFSWIPQMIMKNILRPKLKQEGRKPDLQALQIFQLTEQLMDRLLNKTYSEVMQTLSENKNLFELFKDFQAKRITIQNYQNDTYRKQPLLGMQHIIECARVGPCASKHYLCTLCGLPVANHMIINHIISFDHIYSYFKAWHPSTLQSKLSYRNYNLFVPTILNFAKLAEKIHETQHASMKQVRLQPDEFQLVNFTCYSEALEKLESITKSSLKTSVTPGHKIEYDAVFSPPKPFPKSHNLLLRCQNCCHDFESMPYLKHLSQPRHKKQLMKQFLKAVGENSRDSKVKLHLDLYTYSCEGLKTKPLVGVDLVVTCISSSVDVEPICLCFGCLERVPQPVIRKHCESRKHLIKTLMYQNPWRLPFAWKKALDDSMLKSEALEERGPNKISLKVVDIPHSIFYNLSSSINYVQAMKTLQLYHTLLKCEVPPCKTFSKLHQNEKFPLLGNHFLVSHKLLVNEIEVVEGFLCLLCQRRLSRDESHAHVFSHEHVTTFLDCFHPNSLNPSTDSAETLLDLAKQAARIHTVSNIQVINLSLPMWEPCTYQKAIKILTAAKQREGRGGLFPPIKPRMKLVPRKTQKEEEQKQGNDDRKTCLDTGERENEQIKEQSCAEETLTVKENAQIKKEQVSMEETLTVKEKEPVIKKEVPENIYPQEVKHRSETVQVVRVKTEKTLTENNIEESIETCKVMEENKTWPRTKESSGIKGIMAQMSDVYQKKENKATPERSQKEACSNEDLGQEKARKRPRSASKDDPSHEQPAKIPKIEVKKEKDDICVEKRDEKVLNEDFCRISATFFKCQCLTRDPIYLCGGCARKIPENELVSHLAELKHQKMHFLVIHLNEKTYSNILNQSFQSVIQTLQAQKHWPDRGCNPTSTTLESARTPDSTSEIFQGQYEDDRQVVDMEISDSDMCTTSPDSSAETGSACRPSHVKVNKSDSLPAGVKLKVPTAKTNWSPESNLSPDTPVKTIKFETASKAEKMATPHTCSVPTLKSASTSSKRTETTPSFSATISNATPTAKSATQSVQVKSRKGSASEVNSSSGNASQASCRTSSKVGKSSRWDDATPKAPVAHLTKGTSVAPAKMAKTLVKHDSPDAPTKMAHGPKLVGENADSEAHKKTRPSVPRLGTTIPASSENSEPLKEPYLPASKSPSKHSLKVGANQLIVVSCEKKMQVYCLLCSDKLNSSSQSHLTKFDHQHKYMKMKYPEWTAEESQLKSKLRQDLLHLVLIEKDLPHTRLAQKLEVEMVVYEKLRTLSGKKAVEKVKELLRRKDAHIPSIPAADSSSASRQNVFSFCEVSSSDDGMPSSYDEAGKIQDQMAFFQMPEMDSHVKEDLNLMAYDQSLNDEVMEVYDRVQDQVDLEPIHNPGFYAEDVADTTQLEPDAEFQCGVEVTPPAERFGLTVPDKEVPKVRSKKQPDRGNKKLHQTQQIQIIEIDDSESEEDSPVAPLLKQQSSNCGQIQDQLQLSVPQNKTRPDLTLSHQAEQIPGAKGVKTAHSLTPETQRRKSESASQGPRRAFECPQKATPVQTAASSARQSASGPSHGAQQAPNHSTGPGEKSLPQVQHRAVVELKAQNCSNLSRFLSARYKDTKPIIGMEFVWECQGMSAKTFYLCESCQEIISFTDMCQHMVSKNHQTNFLWQNHSQFLDMFLDSNELNEKQKSELFDLVVEKLWAREQAENTDARVLILPSEQHGLVQTAATFSKALQLVKGSVDKKAECHPPISQQNKTGQKAENPSLEKKAGVGDLHVVGERIVIDLEAYPSCSKDAPVVSSVPIAGAHLAPQEACCGLFPQPAFKPHVSNLRNSDPQLQEKPVSESSTSTTSTSTTGQKPKVYLSNESLPNRKRAAETPETLLQSCTISPQKHPLPAKHTPNPVNVMTQHKLDSAFSAVNSAENLTPLAPTDNNSEPTQMKRTVNLEPLAELISMMKQRKFENIQTPPRSALDNAESTSSSDHRRDLKPLNIDSENAKDKTTLGSEHQLVKATAKKNSTSYAVVANKRASFDVKKNLTTGVSAASSANILSAQFVKANRPADETGDAVVVVSTAATAEAKAPHMLPSSSAQDVFTNVSSFSADCAPNNQKTHRMPHNNPEPSGSSQQSISTVISARPNLVQHTFQGSKNWQAHADANRNDWVTSHADPTANLTDTAAVSGGSYAPHGQTVYFTGGDSGSFFTQMPTGYTTQNNPPITAASSTQEYVYPNQMYPDQTGNPLSLPSFSYNVTAQMPPGWECLGVQQQYAFWAREPGSNQ